MTIRFNTRQAVHKLVRSGMPEVQADATVEVAEDARRRLVTTEQFEATLHRALAIQTVVIIVALTAIMAVLLLVFPAP